MSLETYLKRIVKPNEIPYVKQAIKEWLIQKRQEKEKSALLWGKQDKELVKETLEYLKKSELDELLEEIEK